MNFVIHRVEATPGIQACYGSLNPAYPMPCPMHNPTDPFRRSREEKGVLLSRFPTAKNAKIPMLLRHADVRAAAKDWQTYSSDAPFEVPIPNEENVRTVRQLPLEADPPDQAEYRELVAPFFNRAKLPEVQEQIAALVNGLLDRAVSTDEVEVVRQFAIPLQSHALAVLLNMPPSEADVWIGWGTHVFREGDGTSKGAQLELYTNCLLDRALAEPGDNFFSALTRMTFRGRPLTRTEMLGFCSIMFAGGRDTVINSITGVIAHLAENPSDLEFLREDTKRIVGASEEFFRVISPVTRRFRLPLLQLG